MLVGSPTHQNHGDTNHQSLIISTGGIHDILKGLITDNKSTVLGIVSRNPVIHRAIQELRELHQTLPPDIELLDAITGGSDMKTREGAMKELNAMHGYAGLYEGYNAHIDTILNLQ